MQKRMTTRGRPRSGIGTPNHAVAVIVTMATIAVTSQQAPATQITPCDVNPCNLWCPDPDCNPACDGSPNDDDCLMKDCSANGGDSSVDCQKSCCPCNPNCGDPDRGADVSVWPDLTWVGGIVRVTVCSAWPAEAVPCCFGLGPRDSYFTTQTEITCPQVLPAVDWDDIYNDYPLWPPAYDDVPYCTPFAPSHDLSCWLECPDYGCNLTAHWGWVFLPASYTFYLATPLMDGGHVTPWDDGAGVSIGNWGMTIGGHRKFGLMHLDVDIGYTAGWPDDPLENVEPGTWIGANDDFGEGKPTEDWEDDSPCHGSGNYPVINTGVTHLPIDLALIEGINKNDLCGDLYERLSLTLRTTDENLARILTVDQYCSWEKVAATDPIDDFHFKLYPLDERGKWVGWQFYLEGVRPGTVLVELTGIIDGDSYRERADHILVHIAKIDVDVDSDNTNTEAPFGPDGSIEEDRIEERAGEPGRFVLVNDDDDDQDGILDYDDGYNENEDPYPFLLDDDDVTYEEDDFVMLKVKIAPTSIDLDPNKAWVDVQYSADSPDPDVWGSGRIRLWKKPGDQPRDNHSALPDLYAGEGDWIAPGLYTDLGELTPSGTASHEMTFYIEGVNPSGTLGDTDITFWIDPDGPGPAGYVHADTVQVTVGRVDLDVDANRDNQVDDYGLDETWEAVATKEHGAILLVNCDDDDKSSRPGPDANIPYTVWSNVNVSFILEDKVINGPNDVADLAPLVIRRTPIPEGWSMRLEVTKGANHCHVFRQRAYDTAVPANNVAVLGPTSGSGTGTKYWVLDSAILDQVRAGDVTLGVEAGHFAGQDGFDGIVELRLILDRDTDPNNGNDLSNAVDVVQLKAAPFLLLSNVDAPQELYARSIPGDGTANNPSNSPFIADSLPPAGVPVTVVAGTDPTTRWLQDEVEIGYQQAPYGQMHVVLDLYRSSGVTTWPPNVLLSPGVGLIDIGFQPEVGPSEHNFGGNIEVTPPLGPDRPFGLLLFGNTLCGFLQNLLAAQELQAPAIIVPVDWLDVGHVDEVVSFYSGGSSPMVFVADSALGWDYLIETNGENPGAPLAEPPELVEFVTQWNQMTPSQRQPWNATRLVLELEKYIVPDPNNQAIFSSDPWARPS